MFLSGLKCLRRLERQVKFAKNRCCKIKPVAVYISLIKYYLAKHNFPNWCLKKPTELDLLKASVPSIFLRKDFTSMYKFYYLEFKQKMFAP